MRVYQSHFQNQSLKAHIVLSQNTKVRNMVKNITASKRKLKTFRIELSDDYAGWIYVISQAICYKTKQLNLTLKVRVP